MRQLPRQKLGFYLQENLSWEMALIYAWKKYGHGELIGVAHASIRYWDLRYFYDPRCYVRNACNDLPLPDRVAVNGDLSWNMHRRGGYPEKALMKTEALRFLYLGYFAPTRMKHASKKSPHKKILICGDFITKLSLQMLDWLAQAVPALPIAFEYLYKAHPLSPIATEKYPFLKSTAGALTDLLQIADIVFTSNVTCAAMDAYCAGIPVIQLLDGNQANMSPLYGLPGVYYATSPKILENTLRIISVSPDVNSSEIFYIDASLPRWEDVLVMEC